MMLNILGLLIFISNFANISPSYGQAKLTLEMSFPVSNSHVGDFGSALSTYKNNIYTVWLDPDRNTMIAKKNPDGVITTTTIPNSVAKGDMYHSGASVGIDSDGFIHITSGMHHSGWNYWVSDKPEDISSFTFYGQDVDRKPPWKLVSYATFVNDRNGKLFLCYRIKAENKIAWKGGGLAGCVARYDTKSKSWTMLGGMNWALKGANADFNPMKTKVLVWTDKDPEADAYEGYKVNMVVDKNNRLHLNALGQAEYDISYGTGTHAFYAYSDDSGDTWYKADGTKINSLPITQYNGDNAAAKPWPEGVKCLWNQSIVGFGSDLKPIVSYSYKPLVKGNKKAGGKIWSRWDGQQWKQTSNPLDFLGRFLTDDDGVMTGFSWAGGPGAKLMRSTDNGITWTKENIGQIGNGTTFSFDYLYFYNTKQIRFQCVDLPKGEKTGTVKVYTVRL
jgi:hypothetical protein